MKLLALFSISVFLYLLSCAPPTATYLKSGVEYVPKHKNPDDIVVYFSPRLPEKDYTIVGTIIVSSSDENGQYPESKYLEVLRKKVAEIGVDGITNVEIKNHERKQASGGCISGTPYYYEQNYSTYEIKGDAFVWK